jgi:aminoglycoside/choline kinase family phosphotransferase
VSDTGSADLEPQLADLVRAGFGTAAAIVRLEPLAGDASTRRYLRVRLRGPGAPATAVVMVLADRGVAMSSDELAVFAAVPTELPYVNVHHFLAGIGVAVPALYVEAAESGLLVLEDVGDLPLWDAVQGKSDDEVADLFGRAIEQLLLIQVVGTARRDPRCIAFQQVFDRRLFDWEFEHFIEHGLVNRLSHPIPSSELDELRAHFGRISAFLDAQPRVLNHRDFHAWNLHVQDGRIRVIDFQDALLAPAPYDLATLLGDRDTPQVIHPAMERRLLAVYAAGWAERGAVPWSEDALWDVYSACALQKAFKVVGRFHYLNTVKGKPGYLRYLPPTWRQIARLLGARPELEPVRRILARHAPELRS